MAAARSEPRRSLGEMLARPARRCDRRRRRSGAHDGPPSPPAPPYAHLLEAVLSDDPAAPRGVGHEDHRPQRHARLRVAQRREGQHDGHRRHASVAQRRGRLAQLVAHCEASTGRHRQDRGRVAHTALTVRDAEDGLEVPQAVRVCEGRGALVRVDGRAGHGLVRGRTHDGELDLREGQHGRGVVRREGELGVLRERGAELVLPRGKQSRAGSRHARKQRCCATHAPGSSCACAGTRCVRPCHRRRRP